MICENCKHFYCRPQTKLDGLALCGRCLVSGDMVTNEDTCNAWELSLKAENIGKRKNNLPTQDGLVLEYTYEDQLPAMSPGLFPAIFGSSIVIDGVRMFPFVTLFDKEYFLVSLD